MKTTLHKLFAETRWPHSLVAVGLVSLLTGCSGRPSDVAEVAGVVTLDQSPLVGATVHLQMVSDKDQVFLARTNEAGEFKLMYGRGVSGAKIGEYKVRISTYMPGNPDADPPLQVTPERLPKRYTSEDSELTAVVEPGDNQLKFDLTSDGEVIQPPEPQFD